MTNPDAVGGGRTALLLGATGLVGGHCLDLLLEEPAYREIRSIGRRPVEREHPRLVQTITELDRLEEHAELFAVDDVFCCLGTTIRSAGSREAFRRVDVEYPATAARLAATAGADRFLVVSALGADAESRVFYNRAKGEMETIVRRHPFQAVWILRPSLLLGDRQEERLGERLGALLARPLEPLLRGPLRRYRPIAARSVAIAMLRLALDEDTGGVVESDEIARLAEA